MKFIHIAKEFFFITKKVCEILLITRREFQEESFILKEEVEIYYNASITLFLYKIYIYNL